jgi:hypothetical protein
VDLELVYKCVHLIVFPAWVLLIFAPNWRFTDKFVHAAFIPLIMVMIYIYFIGWAVFFGAGGGGFNSLEQVMTGFDYPVVMLGGWVHYLVFDLFVGMWIARDGKRHGMAHGWLVPCLIFACLFGPVGLGLYLILRKLVSKADWSLHERLGN